jgi:hypothetical protein
MRDYKTLVIIFALSFIAPNVAAEEANQSSLKNSSNTNRSKRKSTKKKRRKKRKKATINTNSSSTKESPVPAVAKSTDESGIAVGINGGYEAMYGNSFTAHYFFSQYFDVNAGVGYNSSGLKVGGGSTLYLPFTDSLAFLTGAALVHSAGNSGQVGIAKNGAYQPANGGPPEDVEILKDYKVADALLASIAVGGQFEFSHAVFLTLQGNYNVVVAGNEVTLAEELKYNLQDISVTNEADFEERFDEEAQDKAASGGLGFSVGLRLGF